VGGQCTLPPVRRWAIALALLFAILPRVSFADSLDIHPNQIRSAVRADDSVIIQLTDEAAKSLEAATRRSTGSELAITVSGIEAFRATVQTVVDSGSIRINDPSDELLALFAGDYVIRHPGRAAHDGDNDTVSGDTAAGGGGQANRNPHDD